MRSAALRSDLRRWLGSRVGVHLQAAAGWSASRRRPHMCGFFPSRRFMMTLFVVVDVNTRSASQAGEAGPPRVLVTFSRSAVGGESGRRPTGLVADSGSYRSRKGFTGWEAVAKPREAVALPRTAALAWYAAGPAWWEAGVYLGGDSRPSRRTGAFGDNSAAASWGASAAHELRQEPAPARRPAAG